MVGIKKQFKDNFIALISLVVAIVAIGSGRWREDVTEKNRNIRAAGFEMLKNLGELQIIVNHAYYQPESMKGNPFMGWGQIALISDLSELLTPKIAEKSAELRRVWGEQWNALKMDQTAVDKISAAIDANRMAVLELLNSLK